MGATAAGGLWRVARRHWLTSYAVALAILSIGLTVIQYAAIPLSSHFPIVRSKESSAAAVYAAIRIGPFEQLFDESLTKIPPRSDPQYRLPPYESPEWSALAEGLENGMWMGYGEAQSPEHAMAIRAMLLERQARYRTILDRPDLGVWEIYWAVLAQVMAVLWLPAALVHLANLVSRRRRDAGVGAQAIGP